MKLISTIRMAVTVVFAVAAWTRAAEPAPEFAPAFRSGMVLADWRGSAGANVVLHGRQAAGQTVFVRIGSSNEEIKTKSEGAEWRLTVKELNNARLAWPAGPCVIEATAKERNLLLQWEPVSPARRLTNVLIGSVWVVAVPAAADWSQARENKFTNGFVRFHMNEPSATNDSDWFPSGPQPLSRKLPKVAEYFAEKFFQQRREPVGIYLVPQKPPGVDEDFLKRWTQERQTAGGAAALAAGKLAVQASRAERAAFVARSRAAKLQGAVIEGEVPLEEGADFSLRQYGASPEAWLLFHEMHVHGFLW